MRLLSRSKALKLRTSRAFPQPIISQTGNMTTTSFRTPPQPPIAFSHTPESVIQLTKDAIDASRLNLDKIAATDVSEVSFENTLLPFASDENTRIQVACITSFYKYVSPSKELRDASQKAHELWSASDLEIATRKDIYKVFQPLNDNIERLDPESQHYFRKKYKTFVRNGLNLDAEGQKQYEILKARIDSLKGDGSRNLREESGGIWFTKAELDGVSSDILQRCKVGEVASENEGKLWVTFKQSNISACLAYAKDPNTRRRIFLANQNKCEANIPLFKELVKARAEAAKLLGFKSHVDYTLQERMMSEELMSTFLKEMQEEIKPEGEREISLLRKIKREDLISRGVREVDIDDRIFLWDENFYIRLMKETQENIDQTVLSEYFPLETTVDGLLKIFETLFGISFIKITSDIQTSMMKAQGKPAEDFTWNDDVTAYAVWNESEMGGNFLGYLYLDLFERDGKHGNPCVLTFATGYTNDDGTRQFPSTALLCPFAKPTTKPTLLRHRNVVSIFHELGHGIHNLVGNTRYADTHGTSVRRDFVEVPSKMLENWCWIPSILQSLSHHYAHLSPEYMPIWKEEHPGEEQPPLKAPLEMMKGLAATRNLDLAMVTRRQLYLSKYDILVHSARSGEEVVAMDLSGLYNQVRKEVGGLCGPEVEGKGWGWSWGQSRFLHLFGGYSAGYYCYALATVYSRDMFETKFRDNPMSKEEGRRYRELVIGKGGSEPEMQLLVNFLDGRVPNGAAFSKALAK